MTSRPAAPAADPAEPAASPLSDRAASPRSDRAEPTVPDRTDVLVIGAGPAGSSAATWAARAGLDVVLADAAAFPRDKTCGDGLTPRAIEELRLLDLGGVLRGRARNRGLRAGGFGQELYLPWPAGRWPRYGSAVPRREFDAALREAALAAGAVGASRVRAVDVERHGDRVTGVVVAEPDGGHRTISCRRLVVADGARSPLGRALGRTWHRDTVYGVAARGYAGSARADDPWISSHLELRGASGELLSGYGWIFPLSGGQVNVGVGTLATARHPANLNLRALLDHYAGTQQEVWALDGPVRESSSALLPMGGAVSGVAGRNWALIGDAAACVNPLNGEGIDYGLETGRLIAAVLAGDRYRDLDLTSAWPATLRRHYGDAFSIARRLAGLLTVPGLLRSAGPVGMRSLPLMRIALRVMGNLVDESDRDTVARLWRTAGRLSVRCDERPPFPAPDLRS